MINLLELNNQFNEKKVKNNYAEIVKKGYLYIYYEVNKLKREIFKLKLDFDYFKDEFLLYQCFSNVILYDFYVNPDIERLCGMFSDNRNRKCKRYADKIKQLILNSDCIFGTLTLNDDNLYIDYDVMRKRLQRFFNKLSCHYICNIDYGNLNERPHYHFIADVKMIDPNLWKYGFSYFERIKNKKEFSLSDYINKMCNHASKASTKNNRIMCNF